MTAGTEGTGFAKVLRRRDVVTLAFGAMIGWSWVLLTGEWLVRAGSAGTVVAFVIGGLAVALISLTYAELAAAMPKAGGEHVYTYRALGYGPSFMASWAIVMTYVTVCVFESAALPTALEYLWPDLKHGFLWRIQGSDVYLSMVAIGIAGAVMMTVVNYVGIRFAVFVQSVITGLFFLVGVSLITGAFGFELSGTAVPLFNHGVAGVLGVLVMVPALMVGFDVIPQSAEEINLEPQLIGKLLVLSVCMAVAWYVLISLAVSWTLDEAGLEGASIATADANASAWRSSFMGNLMVLAGIGGILTSWNAFMIGGSRVLYALGESGMIPSFFSKLHPVYRTPGNSILVIGALSCLSPFFGRTVLVWLVDAGSFMVVIAYGLVAFSFLKLRRTEPEMRRPFRVPCGRLVGYSAVAMSVGLGLIFLPGSPSALLWPWEWVVVLGGGVTGFIFYVHSIVRGQGRKLPTFEN